MAKQWTFDDYYNDAQTTWQYNQIFYDRRENLDEWLKRFPPSKMRRSYGHGFIKIHREAHQAVDSKEADESGKYENTMESEQKAGEEQNVDEKRFQQKLDELQQSWNPASFKSIAQLAVRFGKVSGVWLFTAKEDDKADNLWALLAKEYVHGDLARLSRGVKVSPKQEPDAPDRTHIFLVHHDNFTDEGSVFELEKALRRTGIRQLLMYKLDIHITLQIYKANQRRPYPSIYSSCYEPSTRSFSISHRYKVDSGDPSCRRLMPRTTLWDAYYVKYIEKFSEVADDDLSTWLDKYAPSRFQASRQRIHPDSRTPSAESLPSGWIVLESQDIDVIRPDIRYLQREWQRLKESGNPIDVRSIVEMAKRNKVVSGGWLFRVAADFSVDVMWKKIAENFAGGLLTGVATKVQVSPPDPEDHVIVVKNMNFTDLHEVFRLHDQIRAVGVETKLVYRPDVFTHLVMSENIQCDIKPILYLGQYDVLKRESKVICLHDELVAEFCLAVESDFDNCEEEIQDTEMGISGKYYTRKSRNRDSPMVENVLE